MSEDNKTPGEMPEEMNTLVEAAVAMHEMFLSLMAGGFTESQALVLVSNILKPPGH